MLQRDRQVAYSIASASPDIERKPDDMAWVTHLDDGSNCRNVG